MRIILLFSCLLLTGMSCNLDPASSTADILLLLNKKTDKTSSSFKDPNTAVQAWNQAINERDYELLGDLYAEELYYYKDKYTKAQAVAAKKKTLDKLPMFTQRIQNIEVVNSYYNTKEVFFEKEYGQGSKKKWLLSMLSLVKNTAGNWQISQESDKITHRNKGDKICSCSDYLVALYNGGGASYYRLLEAGDNELIYLGDDNYYYLFVSFDLESEEVTFFPREERGTHAAALGDYDIWSMKKQVLKTYQIGDDEEKGEKQTIDARFLKGLSKFCK